MVTSRLQQTSQKAVAIFCGVCYTEKVEREKINSLGSVTLAYIGDAVFSLFVRERVVSCAEFRAGECNARVNALVKAAAQADMLETVLPVLTEDEKDVVRRGRNCHTPAKAKNTSLTAYKRATALEALFGWLYLRGETARLQQLQEMCVNAKEQNK